MRRARSRPSSAYLLFVAAGSPALGEEGFAPAGSIFAAGVLAFAAAVPAVAFSPLGVDPVPVPAAPLQLRPLRRHLLRLHPGRLATMRPALPPGRALRQKPTSCSALHFLLVPLRRARRDKASTPRGVGCGYHLLCLTLISSKPDPDNAAGDLCVNETQHVDFACAALRNPQPIEARPFRSRRRMKAGNQVWKEDTAMISISRSMLLAAALAAFPLAGAVAQQRHWKIHGSQLRLRERQNG